MKNRTRYNRRRPLNRLDENRAAGSEVREAVKDDASLVDYPAYALLLTFALSVTLATSYFLHLG